ncbi:MAG: excinuclease ABC subunit UvrC [Deltaproteobacteria bacterium]|nr:excinuclease ABC subunit UvrC [Deltaproteobacteria bacterium]
MPKSPGVYLMKDSQNKIIYVGKAKILPKRVSSYFRDSPSSPRTGLMVSQITSFEFMVASTEKEALILENSLIKKHRPKYNVILRDDKTYPSLRLSRNDPFPRLEIVRRPQKDGSVIFGPFPSVSSLKETLKLVNRLFPLRKCRRPDVKKTDRPCLNFQIGQCTAPCRPEVSAQEYKVLTDQVRLFFLGQKTELLKMLEKNMKAAAERYDFETAATYRDRLTDVKKTLERQVAATSENIDLDVWALVGKNDFVQATVLNIRSGVVTGCRPLSAEGLENVNFSDQDLDAGAPFALVSLLSQYYAEADFIPQEISLKTACGGEEANMLVDWLSSLKGSKVKLTSPKGVERQKLMEMAYENAKVSLEERLERLSRTRGAMAELMARLALSCIPRRLECFDLAHLQGEAAVAGMVVMEEGDFKKSQYRKFRLKSTKRGDDYGGLQEVVKRRFRSDRQSGNWPNPDLLLIDGGRGQLSSVIAAFSELGVKPPPMAAIAKDRQHGGPERVFIPGRKNPVDLKPGSAALTILVKLRDEAHRFCRTYHHNLRSKDMLGSVFKDVKGLGPKKLAALLKSYPTLEALTDAPLDEIKKKTSLNQQAIELLLENAKKLLASSSSDAEDIDDAEHADDSKDIDDPEHIDDAEDIDDPEHIDDAEHADDAEDIDDPEHIDDAEHADDAERR